VTTTGFATETPVKAEKNPPGDIPDDQVFIVKKVETADRPAGRAVYVAFESNSEPNAVTNKQIRLENDRYLFTKSGKIASVTFSAPKGADNADQWLMMSKSFRWR
jgi:hypothetical protein